MESQSNSNSNSNSNSSSDNEELKQQSRDELANEIFGSLESDAYNNRTSSSSSVSSSPIIMMKKQSTAKEPSKNIEIPDVKEGLNEYFKLKQKYENQIMINKKKIINNPSLSKREKRSEYIKLKPKCINCNRPGGTKFIIHYVPENSTEDKYEEPYREYSATCGIIADPCNLNIKIQIGITELLPDILNTYQNDIKNLKNKVIDDKNKLLFGYITTEEALDSFEKIKDDISRLSGFYEFYLEEYNNIVDNDKKKQELDEAITQSYIEINNIKEYIKRMNETDNIQFAKDAVNIYNGTLKPLLDKIRHLKYSEYIVLHNEENNTCNLIQNKYTIEDLLFTFFQNKVTSYTFGTAPMLKQKSTPKFIVANDLSSTTSTLPLPDTNNSNIHLIPGAKSSEIPRDEPEYGKGKDGITWHLNEYNKLWDNLPLKLKNALKTNKEWMVEFMFNCVNARAKREACKFIAPRELKVPPEQMANGQYDFGVEIYNSEFNKLSKSLQETYLSHYSTKDGVKNYSMLENSLNELVSKSLDFNKGFF